MDARELLRGLVGTTIYTITGRPNRVLSINDREVIVGTERSPDGEPVAVEWVQDALDQLLGEGEVRIHPESVGHRSAFVGAALLTLPNAEARTRPAMVLLVDRGNAWNLQPGDSLSRRDIHDRFGGGRRGGIAPSRISSNVLIFTNPRVGHLYGYNYDGRSGDGTFHYTGEGQRGDQQLRAGNKAILEHRESGRSLRLFQSDGSAATYLGEFEVHQTIPYFRADAPEVDNGPLRSVLVFRLLPVGDVVQLEGTETSPPSEGAVEVPVEQHNVETFERRAPEEQSSESVRREAALVRRYESWLEEQGHQFCRNQVSPPGELNSLYTDLFDLSTSELVEAKGTVSRPAMRMAIGQLADYSRFVAYSSRAVLVPSEPRADLLTLLMVNDIACIWEVSGGGFDRRNPKVEQVGTD